MIKRCLSFPPKNIENLGEFICHTCLRNLKNNKMPMLAIANQLELKPLPQELTNLCELELHLLAYILPLSKIVGLRGGAYQGVKGESVYVPIEPNLIANTISTLPRKLTDPNLIPLKLKRRLRFHGYYMFQSIRKSNVEKGLDWLIANNPFYHRIKKDPVWFVVDNNHPNADSYNNLCVNIPQTHDVLPHETETNHALEEDEIDGKNLLFDSTFVDKIPTLPITDSKDSFSIAPGENQTPVSKITDNLDQLANPGVFPYGEMSFSLKREVPLSLRNYYKSLLQRQDSRCTKASFVFHAQNQVENRHMQSSINFQSKKQFSSHLTSEKEIKNAISNNKAWTVFKQVRTTPGYWETAKKDVLAMIQQLGPFTFWLTFSANDLNWITPIKQVAAHEGVILSDDDVDKMPYLDRIKLINKNPAAVTLYLYDIFRLFVFKFQIKTEVYGKIKDYVVKIEFQQRGTPHIHQFLWIENSVTYGVHSNQEVCNFIDKYIHCSIPENSDDKPLMELVIGCQTHRCMKTRCKKNNEASCKFDFPKLPSGNTIISKGRDCEDYKTMPANVKTRIDDVYKLVKNKLLENGKEFCSLHEFLKENGISAADYDLCLLFHHKEPTVILKRNPNECWINSYNPHSLKLLKSNQDISFALQMYGCICYLLSYLCKAERNVSKLMKEAMIKENETASLLSSMKNIWMNKREMSYPEAIFHLLSLPLLWKSRDVVFLSTNYPENRIRLIKQNKSEGDKQVFHDGIIEYYQNRPLEKVFETMPLVTFASWYVRKCVKSKLSDQDGEETCENIENSKEIQLLNGKGFMVKKFSKNIIRLPKLNLNEDFDESEQFFFSKLMTYVPWRCDRLSDVKCGFNTFKECYAHHAESIKLLMQEYEKGSDAINDAFLQISEREPDLDKNVTELQNGLEENIENNSCFPTDEDATLSDDDFAINTNQTNSSCQFEETIKRNSLYYQEIREKISFTGMASANIDGRTWHSFLGLGKGHGKINGLNDMKAVSKATTRDKLKSVQVVIEDEMSLESSQMDNYMNDLLNHVFETPQAKRNEVVYGDISMIKVGDFMQLNMFGTPLYENVSTTDDPYDA